jgi:hypothetical protein
MTTRNLELETIEKAQASAYFMVQELRALKRLGGESSQFVADRFIAEALQMESALNELFEKLIKEAYENH